MKIADISYLQQMEENGVYIKGLFEATNHCYQSGLLPDELGYGFAVPSVTVCPANMKFFSGGKL